MSKRQASPYFNKRDEKSLLLKINTGTLQMTAKVWIIKRILKRKVDVIHIKLKSNVIYF